MYVLEMEWGRTAGECQCDIANANEMRMCRGAAGSWLTCRLGLFSILATLTHHRKVQNFNSYHFFDWLFKVLISNLHIHAAPSQAEKEKQTHTLTQNKCHRYIWAKFHCWNDAAPSCWIEFRVNLPFPLCMKLIFTGPCSGWFNFFLVYADADFVCFIVLLISGMRQKGCDFGRKRKIL